jgi:hypothetical protein
MTARFETLVYTDCRPGQGIGGGAGLQFQARSSEAAAAAEAMVRDHLLYEPYSAWMAANRAPGDYPPSFAHLAMAGFLATATGCYLGQEANGTREGNQLTHAIVTTEPGAYGGLRPAQLFGAAFWAGAPAPTTVSPPVELARGAVAYSPTRARDFVLAQPNGEHLLRALVSALAEAGKPGKPRVLFVGDDVPIIVEWLVAGTLLIPRDRAFELGFKIFATDPARSALPVLAVHREFAGAAGRIDNQLGYAVFDLAAHDCTPLSLTWAARRWVDLFLNEDPRDVVDALDVAAESELAPGPNPQEQAQELAMALGTAAILRREPDERFAEDIVDWLRTGPEQLRNAYAGDVAEIFAELPERWSRRVLVRLDAVGCDGLIPGKAAEVRIALIICEIGTARTAGRVFDEPLGDLPADEWLEEHGDQVFRMFVEALTAGVSGAVFEALLRVAKRFAVEVHPDDLGESGSAFIRYWAEHPGRFQPRSWPQHSAMVARLEKELTWRVGQDPQQAAIVGDGWRQWLLPRLDILDRTLQAAVLGATVRHGDDRTALVERRLRAAHRDREEFEWVTGALWSQSRPTVAELSLLAGLAPDGADPPRRIFQSLVEQAIGPGPVTPDQLELCRILLTRGLMPGNGRLRAVLAADDAVSSALAEANAGKRPSLARAAELVAALAGSPPRLITMHAAPVTAALLRVAQIGEAERMLKRHPALLDPYLERLNHRLRTGESERDALAACYLGSTTLAADPARQQKLFEAWDEWLIRAGERRVDKAGKEFAEVSKEWHQVWKDRVDSVSGRRRRYRIAHPFGGGR